MMNETYYHKRKKSYIIPILLGLALVFIISALIYFNTGSRASVTGDVINDNFNIADTTDNKTNIEPEKEVKKHIPLNLSGDDILVSFRIDDITFKTNQKKTLENALYLARKYNITFDLAVIAKPFDEKADSEVFQIYKDNQDVFEVVAHGWDHADYQNENCHSKSCFINKSCGEFKCAPYGQQEEHISKMKQVFEKNDLYWGTKIFLLPWHAGDENTINIAEKYGYKLMTQLDVPNKSLEYNNGKIIISKVWIGIAMNKTLTQENIDNYKKNLNNLINKNQPNIQITTHPVNFYKIENSEELIRQVTEMQKNNPKIKFSMISDGLGRS